MNPEWWQRCMQSGPRMRWSEVMQSRHCQTEEMCAVFKDRHPSTVAMTVLVVVEMFNALNALSENNSLLQARGLPPPCRAALRKPCHVCECLSRHGGPSKGQQSHVNRGCGLENEAPELNVFHHAGAAILSPNGEACLPSGCTEVPQHSIN